MFLFSP
jgi:hypothetical protein